MMHFHVAALEHENLVVELAGQRLVLVRHDFHLRHVVQKETQMILGEGANARAHIQVAGRPPAPSAAARSRKQRS